MRDMRGDFMLACRRSPWRLIIHNSLRDRLAQQLRRMGATVDPERWFKPPQIDVVTTIPGKDGLAWLDETVRRSTAVKSMHLAANDPGVLALLCER